MLRFDPTPFDAVNGIAQWALILGAFLAVALIVSFCVALATAGWKGGIREFKMHFVQGLREVVFVSPRRIWAIAQLVIRESIRRKALLVFVVFALLFMFGSWFITDSGDRPEMQAVVHITFVLKAIAWLSVPVVLLLACWGLPQDIKQRSLHTVVTKPVRRSEVVIGRILGFAAIGTLILGVMAVAGHIWIKRQVPADAQSLLVSRVPIYGELEFTDPSGNPGEGVNTGDIWEFRSYIAGATAASAIWTFEDVTPEKLIETASQSGEGQKALRLEYNFEAFRTHKGRMGKGLMAQFKFINDLRTQMAHVFSGLSDLQSIGDKISAGDFAKAGEDLQRTASGIQSGGLQISDPLHDEFLARFRNLSQIMEPFVGSESFASAGEFLEVSDSAQDAARSRDDKAFADQLEALAKLLVEHTDDLEKNIVNRHSESSPFQVIEYKRSTTKAVDEEGNEIADDATTTYYVGTKLKNDTPDSEGTQPATLDLFEDLTHGNRLRVAVSCLDGGQYLGMARPDLYIRTPDRTFEAGYYKAVTGTWLMLILVVVLGVTASTFVKGPVATLLTCTLIVVGLFFHAFLEELVTDKGVKGFGAIESVVRLVEHKNPTVALEESQAIKVMKGTDRVILGGLWTVYKTVPNFNAFALTPYVANGFDVPFDAGLLPAIAMTLAYIIPCLFIGYFSLRLRELEAK